MNLIKLLCFRIHLLKNLDIAIGKWYTVMEIKQL